MGRLRLRCDRLLLREGNRVKGLRSQPTQHGDAFAGDGSGPLHRVGRRI
jgi:hypothetical protein